MPVAAFLLVMACQPSEAPRVELPVVIDGSGLAGANNELGWTIELSEARVVIRDLRFTTAGELDERVDEHEPTTPLELGPRVGAWLGAAIEGQAWAHPGHFQDGEVIGELPGTHVVDFIAGDGDELGVATLIVGDYTAANFGLARASESEVDSGDALLGHTTLLAGVARRDEAEVAFTIYIDSPTDREITGVPFDLSVTETSAFSLGLRMLGVDPFEGDGLYTGIDFEALDASDGAADGAVVLVDPEVVPGQPDILSEAYYAIRREFQTHDLFEIGAL